MGRQPKSEWLPNARCSGLPAAKLLSQDEARIAVNVAKLPMPARRLSTVYLNKQNPTERSRNRLPAATERKDILEADHPAIVFQVVGLSRDDGLQRVLGGKPSSRLAVAVHGVLTP
jgi:hypothetical protein